MSEFRSCGNVSCLRIYTNFALVFVDNYWMTSLSGSLLSVPSILPNAERYWFSLLVL